MGILYSYTMGAALKFSTHMVPHLSSPEPDVFLIIELFAPRKCVFADIFDGVGKVQVHEFRAIFEGVFADRLEGFREIHFHESCATFERTIVDGCYAIGEMHFNESCATLEGVFADRGGDSGKDDFVEAPFA